MDVMAPRRPLPYRNGRRLGVEAEQVAGSRPVPVPVPGMKRILHASDSAQTRAGACYLARFSSPYSSLFVVLFAADSRSQAPSSASCELLHVR